MDQGLRVRNEGSPLRCEICHQSDCLDEETFECLRCRNIPLPELPINASYKEESFNGLVIPFGRLREGRSIIAAVLAMLFAINMIGLPATVFISGMCFFITGINRVLTEREITGKPSFDFALNLSLMSAGLAGCCYSGIYFLRLFGVLR